MQTITTNEKHSLAWFEQRIGQKVFRPPHFEFEKGKQSVGVFITDKRHAEILHRLQRSRKDVYKDHQDA